MANGNPFLPGVSESFSVDPASNPWNMYFGKLNHPITDYSGVGDDLGLSRDNPFGHGVQDIDWRDTSWSTGRAPVIPQTGDESFDQGLKIALESGNSANVIDFLKSSDKDKAMAIEPYILDHMNTIRSGPTQTEGVAAGSGSSTDFSNNPFARILAEVLGVDND